LVLCTIGDGRIVLKWDLLDELGDQRLYDRLTIYLRTTIASSQY
jgi:hypothetical protein